MLPLGLPLALALLTSPIDSPVPVDPSLLPHLQTIGVAFELLDPRELRYVLVRTEDLQADVKMLRRRWHDMADAPLSADAAWLPDRTTINDLLQFNRAYYGRLERRLELEPWQAAELFETAVECERLYQVWDAARDARCDYYCVTVRRQALKKLRGMLGPEAYYRGAVPPHVPLWSFARID